MEKEHDKDKEPVLKLIATAQAAEEDIQLIIHTLEQQNVIEDTGPLARKHRRDHANQLVPALNKLQANNKIKLTPINSNTFKLSEEAELYIIHGTPEYIVWRNVPESGIDQKSLMDIMGNNAKIGFSQAIKLKWIGFPEKTEQEKEEEKKRAEEIKKAGGKKETPNPKVIRLAAKVEDKVKEDLIKLKIALDEYSANHGVDVVALKKRQLVVSVNLTTYKVEKGSEFGKAAKVVATELTLDMMLKGEWKNTTFKPYNLNSDGKLTNGGYLHPLLKVRTQFREILLELGFEEMPTQRWVESSFWNFDALYTPQQHPARDAQDTFFIREPSTTKDLPEDYLHITKQTHEKGGWNSIGYRYDWKESEARKNVLRTHTTAISTQLLHKLAKEYKPAKYFSIDRVFRNENMDHTHLCEFHQVEGVVCDKNLTLGDLMGVIQTFFARIGIPDVKFKPAFNPYTEPSMEIFGFHPQLGRWVEIGNSGMFRPEMLLAMGLPEDVNVIAWGLSLERPTMILYGIDNIRDLFGHKVKIETIINNPICRLDKKVQTHSHSQHS